MASRNLFGLAVLASLGSSAPAFAALSASADIAVQPVSGGYHYSITLHNTGDTTIGTFWYAWVPGQDFMPSSPTLNGTTPASPGNWGNQITPSAGYAILWTANSSASYLPAGGSLGGFSFDSADAPSVIFGITPAYPGQNIPTSTSFVYSAGPFSDSGFQFVAVPEPTSVAAIGVLGLLLRRKPR